jgi:hypothetical protein
MTFIDATNHLLIHKGFVKGKNTGTIMCLSDKDQYQEFLLGTDRYNGRHESLRITPAIANDHFAIYSGPWRETCQKSRIIPIPPRLRHGVATKVLCVHNDIEGNFGIS